MNRFNKIFSSLFFLLTSSLSLSAQATGDVEMADALHANGKIYVVVIVLSIIFAGLIVFLVNIDRKVSRIERDLKEKKG